MKIAMKVSVIVAGLLILGLVPSAYVESVRSTVHVLATGNDCKRPVTLASLLIAFADAEDLSKDTCILRTSEQGSRCQDNGCAKSGGECVMQSKKKGETSFKDVLTPPGPAGWNPYDKNEYDYRCRCAKSIPKGEYVGYVGRALPAQSYAGLKLATYVPESSKLAFSGKGALVTELGKGSPFHLAGINEGDIIEKINGKPVTTHTQAIEFFKALKPTDTAEVQVWSKGTSHIVKIKAAALLGG